MEKKTVPTKESNNRQTGANTPNPSRQMKDKTELQRDQVNLQNDKLRDDEDWQPGDDTQNRGTARKNEDWYDEEE